MTIGTRLSLRLPAAVLALGLAACAAEDPLTLFRAGRYEAAHAGLLAAAGAGDIPAQQALATQFYLGLGVPRDLTAAARWFETAALAGHPPAQLNLGMFYLNGLGVVRDRAQAFGWFQAAADAGSLQALDYLAVFTDKLTPNQMAASRQRVRSLLAKSSGTRSR